MKKKTNYYEYITKDYDRWDLIAFEFYGNAGLIQIIIEANPNVPIYYELPAGIVIYIPIEIAENNNRENVPPWRR